MRPADALTVSQLIYKTYGPSYFNRDVYYPERVAAQNVSGAIVSFVAEAAASGEIVGHYALERNQPGPVAEGARPSAIPPTAAAKSSTTSRWRLSPTPARSALPASGPTR